MPIFNYVAKDAFGKLRSGSLKAESRLQAMDLLKQSGFFSVELNQQAESASMAGFKRGFGQFWRGVSLKALSNWFRQLSVLLNSGMTMSQALGNAGRYSSGKISKISNEMAQNALAGEAISETMRRYPEVFTRIQISMTMLGEQTGMMHRIFALLADYLDKEIEIRRLMSKSTFYPKLVVVFLLCLPYLVQFALGALNVGSEVPFPKPSFNLFDLALVLVGIWIFFKLVMLWKPVAVAWDALKVTTPFIGGIVKQIVFSKFSRALSVLYTAGFPMDRAVEHSAEACGNLYIESLIYPAAKRLSEGAPIAQTLWATRCFPPMVLDMIATGEQTGDLDKMLTAVADLYEAEAHAKSHILSIVVFAVALLLVGVYVLITAVQFYSGYFNAILNQ